MIVGIEDLKGKVIESIVCDKDGQFINFKTDNYGKHENSRRLYHREERLSELGGGSANRYSGFYRLYQAGRERE